MFRNASWTISWTKETANARWIREASRPVSRLPRQCNSLWTQSGRRGLPFFPVSLNHHNALKTADITPCSFLNAVWQQRPKHLCCVHHSFICSPPNRVLWKLRWWLHNIWSPWQGRNGQYSPLTSSSTKWQKTSYGLTGTFSPNSVRDLGACIHLLSFVGAIGNCRQVAK